MTGRTFAITFAVVAACLGATASRAPAAGGTDYTVTATSGLYEVPPANATVVTMASGNGTVRKTLPFSFILFGQPFSETWITSCGYLYFGPTSDPGAQPANSDLSYIATHYQNGYQYGVVAPLWDKLSYQSGAGSILSWTAGTAPNRRFVVAWIDYGNFDTPTSRYQFEVKLFEGTGQIEFAYKPDVAPATWTGLSYTAGMNAFAVAGNGDLRWFAPVTGAAFTTGHPANDYHMDPRYVTCTGRITYDRLTPTAAGLGSTTTETPFGSARIDLRQHTGGALLATTYADADGYFTVQFAACNPSAFETGDLFVLSETSGCVVKNSFASGAYSIRVATNVPLASTSAAGALRVDEAADPTGAWRGPANVARAVQPAYQWAIAHTTVAVPQAVVLTDVVANAPTSYHVDDGTTPTHLRIAGPAAADPDQWDDPVVQRVYGRHVLALLAPATTAAYDDAFDKITSEENAFAEGFGYYFWAAMTGGRLFIDATSATTAVVRDLEDPQPASPKGPAVAAWVAAALYDLVDPANETHDWVDGTGAAADLPLQTVVGLLSAPTVARFQKRWTLQRDGLALSRILIHHGVVDDDAAEPNDAASEATAIGVLPVRRDGLALQLANEDWFAVVVAQPVLDLIGEADFPQVAGVTSVRLEVCDAAGTPLAFKSLTSGTGPVVVHAGARPAGSYKLRLVQVSGDPVPTYDVQASDAFLFAQRALRDWTEGRLYDEPIPLTGGIPPFTVTVEPATSAIPGVGVDPVTLHLRGTPTRAGVYDFGLSAKDGGAPVHGALASQHVVINPRLALPMAEFFGVAADAGSDVALPRFGGTAPFAFTLDSGAPPPGVAFDAATFRLSATTAAPGSSRASFSVVDVAGSSASRDLTIVACAHLVGARTPVDLAADDAACGFYVDAVKGSALSFSGSTAKGSVKRTLRAAVVGADGADVAGAALKGGLGHASATKVVAPLSGRYFFVMASAAGDVAHLIGSSTSRPPTKGKGPAADLALGSGVDVAVGALGGAKLVLKATRVGKSGLNVVVASLVGPDGVPRPIDGLVTTKGTTVTLTAVLPTSGTWTVRLQNQGVSSGRFSYSFTVK
jgi:hypothetical protein